MGSICPDGCRPAYSVFQVSWRVTIWAFLLYQCPLRSCPTAGVYHRQHPEKNRGAAAAYAGSVIYRNLDALAVKDRFQFFYCPCENLFLHLITFQKQPVQV